MGLLTNQAIKKFEFQKSKMADSRHFEKDKSPYMSATVWPILKMVDISHSDANCIANASWPV